MNAPTAPFDEEIKLASSRLPKIVGRHRGRTVMQHAFRGKTESIHVTCIDVHCHARCRRSSGLLGQPPQEAPRWRRFAEPKAVTHPEPRQTGGDPWNVSGESISLFDCELPHIAREAFVVKYPRRQDHFRHTSWRTGDASPPGLEHVGNRGILPLVGAIYDASLDPALWPGVYSRWTPGGGGDRSLHRSVQEGRR